MRWKLECRTAVLDRAGCDATETGEIDGRKALGDLDRTLEPDVESGRIVPWVDRNEEMRRSLSALEGNGRTGRARHAKRPVAKPSLCATEVQERSHRIAQTRLPTALVPRECRAAIRIVSARQPQLIAIEDRWRAGERRLEQHRQERQSCIAAQHGP